MVRDVESLVGRRCVMAVLLISVLAFAACGGDDDGSEAESGEPSATTAASSEMTGAGSTTSGAGSGTTGAGAAKNESHWNAGAVKVGGYRFVHAPFQQAQAGIAALSAGQVDVTFTEPSQLEALSGNLESFARVSPSQMVNLHVCKREGPLADARVRKAINKALDRETISEAVFFGTAEPATQMWPTGHRFNIPELDEELAYDPEAARALLEEAGYADGFEVDLYVVAAFGNEQVAEVMTQQLAEIGVTLHLHAGANYVEDFLKPNRPALGIYPADALGTQELGSFVGTSLGNVCRYEDPELTRLAGELALVSESSDEAVELWGQVSEIVIGDALGVFIEFRSALAAYNPDRLGNLESFALGQYVVPDPFTTFVKAGS